MVSLRSGSCIGTDQSSDQGHAEVQSCGPKSRRRAQAAQVPQTELAKPSKSRPSRNLVRTASRLGEKLDFLQSPAVHTRSGHPIPVISLSSELPELSALAVQDSPKTQAGPQPDVEEALEPTELITANASSEEAILPAEATISTPLEDAEALESDANAKEAALEATEPFEDLEATASRAEAIPPTEARMSSALEDAEVLESDANARQEARHPTNLPESFQAEQDLGSHHQDEGTTQALGDTKGIQRESEASSTSGESSQGAGEDSESDDASTSDSSDEDEGQLAGLAASMWSALQKQRQGQNSGLLGKESNRPSQQRALSGKHLPGEGDISWQPKTLLPKQLQSKELIARPAFEVKEAADHKQLMAAPRDKKAEAKTKARAKPSDWHELPTTEITDELKRDLRLIRLRGAMDPKRFYKRAEKGKFAAKFAVGTVIEGPAEFFSSRLTNKERKQTITEELLADRDLQNSRKRRLRTLQEEQSRWSHKKHKGSGERIKKKSKSAKH